MNSLNNFDSLASFVELLETDATSSELSTLAKAGNASDWVKAPSPTTAYQIL
jgi:hypothetical protein